MPRPAYTPLDVEQQEETRTVQIPNVLRREEPSRSARRGRRLLRLLHANDPLGACIVRRAAPGVRGVAGVHRRRANVLKSGATIARGG